MSHRRPCPPAGAGWRRRFGEVGRRAHAVVSPGRRRKGRPTVEDFADRKVRRRSAGRGPDEAHDRGGQLLALVLLEEVAGAHDRRVRLPCAPGTSAGSTVAARGDRVPSVNAVRNGLSHAREHLPRPAVGRRGRIVGRRRHQRRELAGAGLVAIVGERRVVGRDDLGGSGRVAQPPLTMRPTWNSGVSASSFCQARNALPGGRSPVGQERVGGHDAGEPLGVLGHQPQPDQPAPVLADQRDVAQVEGLEPAPSSSRRGAGRCSRRARPACRSGRSRRGRARRTQAGADEDGDHLAVQVAPRRLAVQQQHGLGIARALVDVVDPHVLPVAGRTST